jgi:hypothetical protein
MAVSRQVQREVLNFIKKQGGSIFPSKGTVAFRISSQIRIHAKDVEKALETLAREGEIRFEINDNGLEGVVLIPSTAVAMSVQQSSSVQRYQTSLGHVGPYLTADQSGPLTITQQPQIMNLESPKGSAVSSFSEAITEMIEEELANRTATLERAVNELSTRAEEATEKICLLEEANAEIQAQLTQAELERDEALAQIRGFDKMRETLKGLLG